MNEQLQLALQGVGSDPLEMAVQGVLFEGALSITASNTATTGGTATFEIADADSGVFVRGYRSRWDYRKLRVRKSPATSGGVSLLEVVEIETASEPLAFPFITDVPAFPDLSAYAPQVAVVSRRKRRAPVTPFPLPAPTRSVRALPATARTSGFVTFDPIYSFETEEEEILALLAAYG